MRVVVDDGDAVARRLAEADVARDHGVEHQRREVRADLALDVLGELRARVVHRQQHARDGQARVELALDQRQRVEQAGEALRARSTRSGPGTITRSAATSALTVNGPSDGGQSSRMKA